MREQTYTLTTKAGKPVRLKAPDYDVAVFRAEKAGFRILRQPPNKRRSLA
jgi:hypothetical protein